jgi:hypothetical protein
MVLAGKTIRVFSIQGVTMPRSNGNKKKPAHSLVRYLHCEAEPGMFRDELLVFLHALHPDRPGETIKVQLLVDQNEVKNLDRQPQRKRPASGWLKVTLANETKGVAEVVLPQPAQPVGESMLVDVNELKKEAGP